MKILNLALVLLISGASIKAQCNLAIEYNMDGFVLDLQCYTDNDEPMMAIEIESITGGSGVYSIETLGSSKVSNALALSGSGFTYAFEQTDQNANDMGFIVRDGIDQVCYLNPTISSQLISIPFYCFESDCLENIEVEFEYGTYLDIFNCKEETLEVKVNNISGGNGNYALTTLGLGSITYLNASEFVYQVEQTDIDAKLSEIGFLIEDDANCKSRFDLSGILAFTDINTECNPTNVNDLIQEDIIVYPTMVNSNFHIKIKDDFITINDIQIFDAKSSLVANFNQPTIFSFNVNNLNSGIYSVVINTNKGMLHKRIIKQNN